MNLLQKRARNSLLGLAVGDALGWPAMFHRSLLLPPWTRRIRREIDVQREDAGVIRVPMPFSLNQPAGAFSPCPTDDTEWAAWTMNNLLANGCAVEERWVADEWLSLAAQEKGVRGGVSTQAAIENLRRGILPPFSGRDNPHYFDDGSMCRAVPIGIACAGNPALAASATRIDAAVTNFEDGIWTACAVAAAVSVACAGGDRQSVIDAAVNALPMDSWSRRVAEEAIAIDTGSRSILALFPLLDSVLNKEYSDGCVGPETLALSLAIISRVGDRFEEAVTASTSFAKGADAVPAVVGALAGALASGTDAPPAWDDWTLRGICLPQLAGTDYRLLVETFIAACPSLQSREGTS